MLRPGLTDGVVAAVRRGRCRRRRPLVPQRSRRAATTRTATTPSRCPGAARAGSRLMPHRPSTRGSVAASRTHPPGARPRARPPRPGSRSRGRERPEHAEHRGRREPGERRAVCTAAMPLPRIAVADQPARPARPAVRRWPRRRRRADPGSTTIGVAVPPIGRPRRGTRPAGPRARRRRSSPGPPGRPAGPAAGRGPGRRCWCPRTAAGRSVDREVVAPLQRRGRGTRRRWSARPATPVASSGPAEARRRPIVAPPAGGARGAGRRPRAARTSGTNSPRTASPSRAAANETTNTGRNSPGQREQTTKATSGPSTAPAVSSVRCTPNARPRPPAGSSPRSPRPAGRCAGPCRSGRR